MSPHHDAASLAAQLDTPHDISTPDGYYALPLPARFDLFDRAQPAIKQALGYVPDDLGTILGKDAGKSRMLTSDWHDWQVTLDRARSALISAQCGRGSIPDAERRVVRARDGLAKAQEARNRYAAAIQRARVAVLAVWAEMHAPERRIAA